MESEASTICFKSWTSGKSGECSML